MASAERIESLHTKHATLETQLHEELKRPLPDPALVTKLKREKLKLKEEIELLEVQ